MSSNSTSVPEGADRRLLASTTLTVTGEVDIAGRHYVTTARLAQMLGISRRTLSRWDANRLGPARIKVGKLILFDLAKLPEWLAARESELIRNRKH